MAIRCDNAARPSAGAKHTPLLSASGVSGASHKKLVRVFRGATTEQDEATEFLAYYFEVFAGS